MSAKRRHCKHRIFAMSNDSNALRRLRVKLTASTRVATGTCIVGHSRRIYKLLKYNRMKKRVPFSLVLVYLMGATVLLLNLKNYILY